MEKPLLLTDGRYIFMHHLGKVLGPFVAALTEDGQLVDDEANRNNSYGIPIAPHSWAGGRVHTVDNPMFPSAELKDLQDA